MTDRTLSTLSNLLRHRFRDTALRALWRNIEVPDPATVHLVVATKLSEPAFWSESLLGRSLQRWGDRSSLTWTISFENRKGLPLVYNESIEKQSTADVLVFLHDDVWLADEEWLAKVLTALRVFDVVGVAGNRRRQRGQSSWIFLPWTRAGFQRDRPFLSGRIAHGTDAAHEIDEFGPSPAPCELLDGVFLATNARALRASRLYFDTRYSFHFYDMDFCRSARRAGLALGTWPIDLVHASPGSFGSPSWLGMWCHYRTKWGE